VYSFGVVLYRIFTAGMLPYYYDNQRRTYVYQSLDARVAGETIPANQISDQLNRLLERMLDRDPRTRISLDGVLAHDWFTVDKMDLPPIGVPTDIRVVEAQAIARSLSVEAALDGLVLVEPKIMELKVTLTKNRCDKLSELAVLVKEKMLQHRDRHADAIVSLSYPEFNDIMTTCGLQHLGVQSVFELLDLDTNRQIDFRELTLLLSMSGMFTDAEIAEHYSFNVLDTNGDGEISLGELQAALGEPVTFIDRSQSDSDYQLTRMSSGDSGIQFLFQYIRNTSADGNITREQFAKFFTREGSTVDPSYKHAHDFLTAVSLRRK